jgi:hypothetical protein
MLQRQVTDRVRVLLNKLTKYVAAAISLILAGVCVVSALTTTGQARSSSGGL